MEAFQAQASAAGLRTLGADCRRAKRSKAGGGDTATDEVLAAGVARSGNRMPETHKVWRLDGAGPADGGGTAAGGGEPPRNIMPDVPKRDEGGGGEAWPERALGTGDNVSRLYGGGDGSRVITPEPIRDCNFAIDAT